VVRALQGVGQPQLVYKLMECAASSSMWNTRKGVAFALAEQSREALEEHLPTLLPTLYRYTHDPNPRVAGAMRQLWAALVPNPKVSFLFGLLCLPRGAPAHAVAHALPLHARHQPARGWSHATALGRPSAEPKGILYICFISYSLRSTCPRCCPRSTATRTTQTHAWRGPCDSYGPP